MAIPRRELVDESQSGFYHCISRTVRQAYLLSRTVSGDDGVPVVDDHRREWILARLELLALVFAVDCFAIAVLSNHLHVLLRNLPELVERWSDAEVAFRWRLLHPDRGLRKRLGVAAGGPPTREEVRGLLARPALLAEIRLRLSSVSWYMKELKEPIARRANREEGRTGAFWEERFRSVRVLDEAGLLAVSSYIDLNPVRAGMAEDPLLARFTSVEAHLRRLGREREAAAAATGTTARGAQLALWRRLAASSGQATGDDAELEALVSSLDEALFSPAIPSRRAESAASEAWQSEWDAEEDVRRALEGDGGGHDDADSDDDDRNDSTTCSGDQPRPSPDASVAPGTRRNGPLRPVPSLSPLHLTLGDYVRRLRLMAETERAQHGWSRGSQRGGTGGSSSRAAGDVRHHEAIRILAQSLAGVECSTVQQAADVVLGAARHAGTAIGGAASLAREALRRGRVRIRSTDGRVVEAGGG